ncbi:hypothetical protein CEXT_530841 [Caerostris extrusa]|uniref:Uncharacterized protein n=1 Tax=Caerostris extrusa TaxID=172846 RepID=A0AAV4S7Z2_CAEEX|nr:hypothetical protein CEXT_530841 [Caerostris extrusa]
MNKDIPSSQSFSITKHLFQPAGSRQSILLGDETPSECMDDACIMLDLVSNERFLSKSRYISVSGHLLYSVSPLAFYWQPIVMSDGTVIAESSTFFFFCHQRFSPYLSFS